jgi:hypothetical protein
VVRFVDAGLRFCANAVPAPRVLLHESKLCQKAARVCSGNEPLQARQGAVAISTAVAVAVAVAVAAVEVARGQATLAKEPQQRVCCRARKGAWWQAQPVKPRRLLPGGCEPLRVAREETTAAAATAAVAVAVSVAAVAVAVSVAAVDVADKEVECTRSLCCRARGGA